MEVGGEIRLNRTIIGLKLSPVHHPSGIKYLV